MGMTPAVTQAMALPFNDSSPTDSWYTSRRGSFGHCASSSHLSSRLVALWSPFRTKPQQPRPWDSADEAALHMAHQRRTALQWGFLRGLPRIR